MTDSSVIEHDAQKSLKVRVEEWREVASGFRQLWLLLGLALAIAAGIWVFNWSQQPAYVPLFNGLDAKDGGVVMDALRAAGTPFEVDSASGAITVPQEKVHELRMKLASQGLPLGNPRAGIESIQGEQGFGVSQFIESARYQSAIETELARTISTLQPVRSARVHLAIPKPTAFASRHDPASASVVLELHPGRVLESNQVAAVVHLVSSSVPGMDPERVTVVDQTGHLLTNPDPDSPEAITARQFTQTRQLEENFSSRIKRLLEPVTGANRVAAQVNVDVDYSRVEEATEAYVNDPAKIRSEQTAEQYNGMPPPAVGVPGATSNTPPGMVPASASSETSTGSSSRSANRNYELDRTLTHTTQQTGRISRVTAAVVVDYVPQLGPKGQVKYRPLTTEELTRMEVLVKQAIGFDEERGDAVSVVNAQFAPPEAPPKPATFNFLEKFQDIPPVVSNSARLLVGALIVLILIFVVLRPVMRQLFPPPAPPAIVIEEQTSLPAPEVGASLESLGSDKPALPSSAESYEDAFQRARSAVGDDPKRVAQLMKNWLNENG